MISIRESFAAKLLSALLGTLALLLLTVTLVVRGVTERQVERVSLEAVSRAERSFDQWNERRRQDVADLADRLVLNPRSINLLRSALSSGDFELIEGELRYGLELEQEQSALAVITDASGVPVVSIINGAVDFGGDPASVQAMSEQLILGDSLFQDRGYRVVGDTVYDVRAVYLEWQYRTVGAAVLGIPIEAGQDEGFQGCYVVAGECRLRTPHVSDDLATVMVSVVDDGEKNSVSVGGEEWAISVAELVPGEPSEGHRVTALSVSEVRAPFRRITWALLGAGVGAMLLAVLLGGALSRSLTRPVRSLVEAARRVGSGDYESRVEIESVDELGMLAGAFNEMTAGLERREQYRSVLSKVVSEDVAEEMMSGALELGGENREISVLFADIRGFTPLTEGMEPQEVIRLLNECMGHLAQAVELEDGIVDKFVGDEVMAVFGAPVARRDHALRAVSAAVRMQESLLQMNKVRERRGEGLVGVGIGVASGTAVAGNMGSPDRLNYTVLGSIVNLAARLTGAAGAGEILVSGETRRLAGKACLATLAGTRALKGFSSEVEVYSVDGVDRSLTRSASTARLPALPRRPAPAVLALSLGVGALVAQPCDAAGQWPTLADAGVGYLSEEGTFQVDLSGQLDLESFWFQSDENALSGLAFGSGYLFAPRARLFLDTFYGDHVYALVEWRGDRGEAPTADFWEARLEQAYLRVGNVSGSFSLQGGIFASPFGSYSDRHLSVIDPFIRPPLMYDYRTVISRRWSPQNADWFSRWKDNPAEWRRDGAPPIWDVPYQWGAMTKLGSGRVKVRLAAMNSAPSSEPADWYEFDVVQALSWIGGVEVRVSPEVSVGASYNKGPYARNEIPNSPANVPPGFTYDQEMWAADIAFARGPVMLRAEMVHDSWVVPNVDEEAVDIGFNAEAQMDLSARWSAAVRFGRIDFRELSGLGDWDWDVQRLEGGIGYRIARNAGVMAGYASTWDAGPLDPGDDLTSIRLWWGF